MQQKTIGKGKAETTRKEQLNVIEVMKPFVGFGLKAMAVLGSALVYIVKNIPKPGNEKPVRKNDRVIKI